MTIAKRITAPFQDIPDFFRREIYLQIFETAERSENVQLVGLWGFGKSLTMRVLESNQESIKKSLKVSPNILVSLSDLSLLADNSKGLVLKHIFAKMLGSAGLQSLDGVNLNHELQKYFDNLRSEKKKIIIILDSLEKLEASHTPEVFSFLSALYKQNMDLLTFVFCFEHEVTPDRAMKEFGDLGRLMFDKILYLTPLSRNEENWFFEAQAKMVPDFSISQTTKKLILDSCGGYMVSLKRLIEVAVSGGDVEEVIANPEKLPGLAYSLDILLNGLGSEIETLKKVLGDNIGEEDLVKVEALRKHYLIDENNVFLSKVLENYLRIKFGAKNNSFRERVGDLNIDVRLTASEYKILEYLNKNKGKVSSREEIIGEVWGEKARRGISDHALDQIVSRLRKKLEISGSVAEIETLRGRGHRLVISS